MQRIDSLIVEFFEAKKKDLQELSRQAWCADRIDSVVAYREAIERIDEILARYGKAKETQNDNQDKSYNEG